MKCSCLIYRMLNAVKGNKLENFNKLIYKREMQIQKDILMMIFIHIFDVLHLALLDLKNIYLFSTK